MTKVKNYYKSVASAVFRCRYVYKWKIAITILCSSALYLRYSNCFVDASRFQYCNRKVITFHTIFRDTKFNWPDFKSSAEKHPNTISFHFKFGFVMNCLKINFVEHFRRKWFRDEFFIQFFRSKILTLIIKWINQRLIQLKCYENIFFQTSPYHQKNKKNKTNKLLGRMNSTAAYALCTRNHFNSVI